MSSIFSSLTQSDFGSKKHGNFEAVIKIGDDLWHYWRDNTDDKRRWMPGGSVCLGGVAGAGAIIQSDFKNGEHGNFEVVVPLHGARDRVELWHFAHDNSDINTPWLKIKRVTGEFDHVVGPASIIQSDFSHNGHGNFEVVVPLIGPHGHAELWHFFRDNSNADNEWIKVKRITGEWDQVMGPGSITQSDFKSGEHGNFEIVVPLLGPNGFNELWHFYHDNSDTSSDWVKVRRITDKWDQVNGPGAILQSDFGDGENHNLEVVVPLKMPNGHTELWHFWHDTDVTTDWQRGQMITASTNGWASFIRSDYGPDDHDNFEVQVEECQQSIVHYWHDNANVDVPWLRGGVLWDGIRLLGEQPIARLQNTKRIVQLTGELDRSNWPGPNSGQPPSLAHNRTESRFGIRGTDLGASFLHKGRIYFLFGDTWRNPYRRNEVNLDSIAFCTDFNPDDGLDLTFYKQPPLVADNAFTQLEFDVPLDGVSFGGRMMVFFSTDHTMVADYNLMGRSVVASSDNDGYDFTFLYEFSRDKFINVSVDVVSGEAVGLPEYRTALVIFGSGRYRSSDVYLAVMPLEEIVSGRFIRYYAGRKGTTPIWGHHEEEAVPLFCAGCVGELSARWNPLLQRWILLYNGDNPRGIVMRSAEKPWGKWSGPVMAFDPWQNGGYGKFMHVAWDADIPNNPHDFVHDDMFGSDDDGFKWRENEWGGEYGPYQISPLTRGETGNFAQVYFTMSTWNPYQVMLMTTTLHIGGPELPGTFRGTLERLGSWLRRIFSQILRALQHWTSVVGRGSP